MCCQTRCYSVVLLMLLSPLLPALVYSRCANDLSDCQAKMNERIASIEGNEGNCNSENTRSKCDVHVAYAIIIKTCVIHKL